MRFNALITFFLSLERDIWSRKQFAQNWGRESGWTWNREQGTGYAIDGILRLQQSIGAPIFYSETSACLSWPCQKLFQLKINDFIDMTSLVSRFSNSILCIMFYKKWLKLFHFKVTVLSWHWANFINNFLPVVRRERYFSSLFLQGRKLTAAVNEIKDHCTYDRFCFQICYPL